MNETSLVTIDFPRFFAGKLLLRQEISLDDTTLQSMLLSGDFSSIPTITQKGLFYKCHRCGNRDNSLFAKIPCQICHKTHVYCRKCITMGRVLACQTLYYWRGVEPNWPAIDNPCAWSGELTAYQQTAANAITDTFIQHKEELLVWAVCGAGKTEMLFPAITEALRLGKRICLATPRADVVQELLPRFRKAFPTASIQGLFGDSKEKDGTAQFIIATTHQLLRYAHAFDLIVVDEVDAFPYHQDESLPFATQRAKKKKGTMIYLTATPSTEQKKRISYHRLPYVFVPRRFHGHALPVPHLKLCFSLKKDLNNAKLPAILANWLLKRANQRRQLLLFVPTIQLAEKLQAEVSRVLIKFGIALDAEITFVHATDQDRQAKVRLFRERKLKVLITTTILERGVTFPSVDVVVIDAGHMVFDEAALVQIAGRAGRSVDDPDGHVLFLHDGKTNALVAAVKAIQAMNKRGGFK